MTTSDVALTSSASFFVAGGTLHRDARCYVTRKADTDLYEAVLHGEFCYPRGVEDTQMGPPGFGLFGVAPPSDLIQDVRTTPFNIGKRIELTDFTAQEASSLEAHLPGGQRTLERILWWTGGNPYMTQ